eukprot:CAMPEP_0115188244 /NCGR_PEP_ID=MMETSP0270-20121206/10909_1 /TAXON_ID=71861 /ORGANISM="Scrippsiella trochoidea, Strain CCMP3099" /LENGTH=339 /DNA_ID=CAMNT_0002601417 /DNA_START=78 /DNA_END=1097 /DNA_ORIENTATION=-
MGCASSSSGYEPEPETVAAGLPPTGVKPSSKVKTNTALRFTVSAQVLNAVVEWRKASQERFNRRASGNDETAMVSEAGSKVAFIKRGTQHPMQSLCLAPTKRPRPPCARIMGATWVAGTPCGSIELPDFDGKIPLVDAAQLLLSFFDCKMIDCVPGYIRMSEGFSVVEFRYNNCKDSWAPDPRPGQGAMGVEMHDFPRFECPLDSDSGHLLLGRWDPDDERALLLTAFKIPQYHTVYLSPNTIHSNEHMNGLWKTVQVSHEESTRADAIDHVVLKDSHGSNINLSFTTDVEQFQGVQRFSNLTAFSCDDRGSLTELEARKRDSMMLSRMGHGHFSVVTE